MRYVTNRVVHGVLCVMLPYAVYGETIVLQDGRTLSAPILKSDAQAVILDLGFDLVRIPRSAIQAIQEDRPGDANVPEPNTPIKGRSSQSGLYYTAETEPTTIERNVDRFAEAVVMVTSPGGQGSGFIINEKGDLITNYHVIANETLIKVTVFQKAGTGFEQRQYRKVRIMALNPFVDLALLRIEDANQPFKHVALGRVDQLAVGQTCFAIGNPLGLTRTVSQGILSSTSRNYDGRLYIQTTTDINPGNSGGPLFNLRGQVIGVTSMGYLFLGGLNFAIPVDVVQRFIENWDAFAYTEDNPNAGFKYIQPPERNRHEKPPVGIVPGS